ncbi:MAG TPA: hypothetical protein VK867_09820 [Candidatus Limnocylindrales bacterium]|nr:hypothetical protein [Candidatus Limnocylindrales bacterium]
MGVEQPGNATGVKADVDASSGVATITVAGELDDAIALLGMAHVGLLSKPRGVVIDLRECTGLDERGVSALFAVERLCTHADVGFTITPSAAVRRRLSHLSLARRLRS